MYKLLKKVYKILKVINIFGVIVDKLGDFGEILQRFNVDK